MRTFTPLIKQKAYKAASPEQQKLCKNIFAAIKSKQKKEQEHRTLGIYALHSFQFAGEKKLLVGAQHDFLLQCIVPSKMFKPK